MSTTSGKPELPSRVAEALSRLGVRPGARLLVALSGGADSVALLLSLLDVPARGIEVGALHVVHNIRPVGEGRRDAAFVRELVESVSVPLQVEWIAPGVIRERARREGRSLEEVARGLRYERLLAYADAAGFEWVAVAHTQSDQLETVVMRLFGGGLIQGLGGIPERRGRIIRPLLGCSRGQVLSYLETRNQAYLDDPTNQDPHIPRNRIRLELVPRLLGLFPSAGRSVERFTQQMSGINALIDECTAQWIAWEASGEGYRTEADRFFSAPLEVKIRSLLPLFSGSAEGRRIPRRFFTPLETVGSRRSGGVLLTGHGATLEQRRESLFWYPHVVLKTKKSYLIRVSEPTMYTIAPTLCFCVSEGREGNIHRHSVTLPIRSVHPPLIVRSRKPGDAIQMREGTKSLKKLLNEWGVPAAKRELMPVVEDRRGILFIAGRAMGYADRYRTGLDTAIDGDVRDGEIHFAFDYSGE